jgi:excisionase family DNA binding protein
MEIQTQTVKRPRVKNMARRAFGLAEIAASLGVSESFIRLEVNRGNLKAYRLGSRILVAAEAFETYLANHAR